MNHDLDPRLIQALRQPDVYPERSTAEDVDVCETHISWIFLCGEYAYKIKKPVRFDFLDFSTLELRRHFCDEELRINRRYAPDIYLEVVPISGSRLHPRIGDDSAPFEYAVKMQRFPKDALLSTMLEQGTLDPTHLDDLARNLGRFHAEAARLDPAARPASESEFPFGSPELIRKNADENLTVLRDLLPDEDDDSLDSLQRWTDEEFNRLHDLFASRRESGFVRECHGDLHLRNLIEWNGRVIPFDGIEFNPGFRWIDIVSDAAFLAMDLDERERPDLSRRFLSMYLESTGDYEGVPLWRWEMVYRALVRAKVAAIQAMQHVDRTEEADFSGARDGIAHALRLGQPSPRRLWITHGFSGSGKTTGSMKWIEEFGAIRVRSDLERKRMFGLEADESSSSATGEGIYTPDASARTQDRLAECARLILSENRAALIDATFLKRKDRDRFRDLAKEMNAEFQILAFAAPEDTLRDRITTRSRTGRDASEADLSVLEWQLKNADPLGNDEPAIVVSR